MTKEEFINLDMQEKTRVLLASGKCFYENASYGKCIWKYYMLFDFIVEVKYSIYTDEILDVTTFERMESSISNDIFQEPFVTYTIVTKNK